MPPSASTVLFVIRYLRYIDFESVLRGSSARVSIGGGVPDGARTMPFVVLYIIPNTCAHLSERVSRLCRTAVSAAIRLPLSTNIVSFHVLFSSTVGVKCSPGTST